MLRIATLVWILLIFPIQALATDPPPRPSLEAFRTQEAINIDGYLDEAAWASAAIATNFKQYDPNEGEPATQRTEVRILYSDDYIYIGAQLYDEDPSKILKTLGRRDDLNQADWFIVAIDSYFDKKTASNFGVNAAGIQLDGVKTDGGGGFRSSGPLFFDRSWDAVWTSSVRVNSEGWSVEMRIPYSMLRFPNASEQTWGLNFRRFVPRTGEVSEWSLIRREDYASGSVAKFGTLKGLQDIKPRRNIQLTPYTVSGVTTSEADNGGTDFSRDLDVGADLKIGITSNITLDATINPDFGQVEADPAVLNLTVFETILQERRPFFVEGIQIFNYRFGFGDRLLYTRRIGAKAPIIGATKLSGRTDEGLSFGFLGAATGHNYDPTRLYSVARLSQQIGDYSKAGVLFTAFENAAPDVTPRRSFTGGADWDLRLKDNSFQLDGQLSFSHRTVPGSDDDAQTGLSGSIGIDKTKGHWTFGVGTTVIGEDFNSRDMGTLRRTDQFRISGFVNNLLNKGKPFGPFRQGSFRMFQWHDWTVDRSLYTESGIFTFTNLLTNNFRRVRFSAVTESFFGGYDKFETRGLFPRAKPLNFNVDLSGSTDTRRTWQIEPGVEFEWYQDEGIEYDFDVEGIWNVGSRLSLEAELGLGFDENRLTWASNEAFRQTDAGWMIANDSRTSPTDLADDQFTFIDNPASLDALFAQAAFYEETSDYYLPIFGRRDNRSFDLSLRSNITFTKDLSLQIFSQLFLAKGKYEDFELIQNPDDKALFTAYPKEHEFSVNSFLINTVLRWEFRPGSTLFVVWSQARNSDETLSPFNPENLDLYERNTIERINDVFGLFPTNAFLIKLNYLIRS